jgi:hypothetical protein
MNQEYFKTNNFYLAVFLFTKGLELTGIDNTYNSRQKTFKFKDTPQRQIYVEAFAFGKKNCNEIMVDARDFQAGIKFLKERLNQDNA